MECMVELVSANKEVVVLARSDKDTIANCASVFNSIVSCVMEAKAEFCHSISPHFFLLDSTDEADCLSPDNLFVMKDVERILISPQGGEMVVVSANGRRKMKLAKVKWFLKLTHWHVLFPLELTSVLHHLESVGSNLYMFGLHLGVSEGVLDALEPGFLIDVRKSKRELVREWMSSSLDPPCWWHVVQALIAADKSELAERIRKKYCKLFL